MTYCTTAYALCRRAAEGVHMVYPSAEIRIAPGNPLQCRLQVCQADLY